VEHQQGEEEIERTLFLDDDAAASTPPPETKP
jgi:hypothetical protein